MRWFRVGAEAMILERPVAWNHCHFEVLEDHNGDAKLFHRRQLGMKCVALWPWQIP
jgi:hypothetical protein